MPRAVVVRSTRRFDAFVDAFRELGARCDTLDFDDPSWVDYDFDTVDALVHYPEFHYTSNHPLTLARVKDNLLHVHRMHPRIAMYPDPSLIPFYNDKYRQALFLRAGAFATPRTIPLLSSASIELADAELGYPMVVKNRFGAGGTEVFRIEERRRLVELARMADGDIVHPAGIRDVLRQLLSRRTYYHLVRRRRLRYPFLSWPLLAQEWVESDRDLKVVVGPEGVVEAHWRRRSTASDWKHNIDGGGIGEWSHVPRAALDLAERIARALGARWINLDMMPRGDEFLVTEFSPVWHHYRFKEKASFVYADDYNIDMPLDESLDLERMIARSLLAGARDRAP